MLGLHPSTVKGPGSVPGRGTKISQATWYAPPHKRTFVLVFLQNVWISLMVLTDPLSLLYPWDFKLMEVTEWRTFIVPKRKGWQGMPCKVPWWGGKKSEKKGCPRAFTVFPTGKAWQTVQNRLGLASYDNVSGLWVLGWSLVSWYLGLAWLRGGEILTWCLS